MMAKAVSVESHIQGSHLSAGPGLDQSGPDGEKIIRAHFISTAGPQDHQVSCPHTHTHTELPFKPLCGRTLTANVSWMT